LQGFQQALSRLLSDTKEMATGAVPKKRLNLKPAVNNKELADGPLLGKMPLIAETCSPADPLLTMPYRLCNQL